MIGIHYSFKLGLAILFLCAFGPLHCGNDAVTWRSSKFKTRDLSREPAEVALPPELFEKIEDIGRTKVESSAKGGGHGGASGGGHEAAAAASGKSEGEHGAAAKHQEARKPDVATVFAPLTVYLHEKNAGILLDGNAKIEFGPGGGEIDLHDFVAPHNGSFYFVTEFLPDDKDAPHSVYFMSNGVARKIDDRAYGAGCDAYFDVSSAFRKANDELGFLVNTTDGRHVTALVGNYFFAVPRDGKLYIASLTIKDSSHKTLQCKRRPLAPEPSVE